MALIESHTLQIQNQPARVWSGGTGPALLLLHGGIGDAQLHWHTVWEQLADTYTVIAPDWPGFGGTPSLPQTSFAALIAWAVDNLNILHIEQAWVIGNSFGSACGRLLAANYPDRVRKLILVDGGAIPRLPQWASRLMQTPLASPLFALLRRHVFSMRGLRPLSADGSILTPDFIANAQANSHGFVTAMRQAAMGDIPHNETPPMPTLVLWGDHDGFTPIANGQKIAGSIPEARFQVINGGGHMPQLEKPAEFVAVVKAFF